MQAKIKNILLVCSDAKESALLQDFLSHLPSSVHITVAATSQELAAFLKKAIPDIIVMRMDNAEEGNRRLLKVMRKDERLDDIPVFVYNISPGKKDLRSLLKKWRKVLSYLPL